jgi:hypothetical protein
MMFNGLDRPFELTNLKNGRKAREVLCFAKHHSLSLSLSLYIYIYIASLTWSGYDCWKSIWRRCWTLVRSLLALLSTVIKSLIARWGRSFWPRSTISLYQHCSDFLLFSETIYKEFLFQFYTDVLEEQDNSSKVLQWAFVDFFSGYLGGNSTKFWK